MKTDITTKLSSFEKFLTLLLPSKKLCHKAQNFWLNKKIKHLKKRNFLNDYVEFTEMLERIGDNRFIINEKLLYRQLDGATSNTKVEIIYNLHNAWGADKLCQTNPSIHHDFGSLVTFGLMISGFIPCKYHDYRPAIISKPNYSSHFCDLMNIAEYADNSLESVSCFHTMEHVGLGRYGDSIDPMGDIKGINELKRILAPNGNLFFVVPIGPNAIIRYNAHRVYTKDLVEDLFCSDLTLKEFGFIQPSGDGGVILNPKTEIINRHLEGCGCFWFVK